MRESLVMQRSLRTEIKDPMTLILRTMPSSDVIRQNTTLTQSLQGLKKVRALQLKILKLQVIHRYLKSHLQTLVLIITITPFSQAESSRLRSSEHTTTPLILQTEPAEVVTQFPSRKARTLSDSESQRNTCRSTIPTDRLL